jgi:hypothetical protein
MKNFMVILLAPCLSACGADSDSGAGSGVVIDGTVMGTSLGESVPGLAVHRLANTPLSPDSESLDLYFGEDFLSLCPDIGEPFQDATTLSFSLKAASIGPGTYPLCDDFECAGNSLDAGFDGWLLPSGETVRPTSGSAELTTFTSERVAGSFTLDFNGEVVTGDFDIDVACVDSRPPA